MRRLLAGVMGLVGSVSPTLGDPVDYDGLVLGTELVEPPPGVRVVFSGLLSDDPRPTSLIPEITRAFPGGLQVGDVPERQTRMGYSNPGAIILAADDFRNNDEGWGRGQINPSTASREIYFETRDFRNPGRPLTRGVAVWQVFGSTSIQLIGFDYDGINRWWLYPELDEMDEDGNPIRQQGMLILNWENIPATTDRRFPDPRRNSFQMIMRNRGDGDADVQLRYARCDWAQQILGSYWAISGFHTGVVRDGEYYPGQTVYDPDSFTQRIKRRCVYSNIGQPGVWEYELRDGVISGCGIADGPYVPSPDDEPGDRCNDNNNLPGDGCSPGCWVEGDADEDGVPDAPPGEPRGPDGMPINPDNIYDNCVSFNPERDCGDLDSDADNVLDRNDNCEDVPNPDQADYDDDGIGDACETDDDRDGVLDFEDLCPQAHSVVFHFSGGIQQLDPRYQIQLDSDKDGLDPAGPGRTPGGDPCDPDDDNDGILDCGNDLICPYFDDGAGSIVRARADDSGEGIPYRDGIDNDLDGLIDEEQPDLFIWEGSGEPRNRRFDRFDNDEDGTIDEYDELNRGLAIPLWPGRDPGEDNCRTIPNPDQANLDGDIWGDACDKDVDGDYILDCGADGLCAFDRDHRDNDRDGTVDEAGECADGCDPANDLIDNDQDGYFDEEPFEFGQSGESEKALGELARQSSEALLAFRPWPGPDEGEDNCPRHRNVEQIDSDGDGIGDACDDDDGDGFFLAAQDPPIPALVDQHAIGQPADNCPDVANPDQLDSDGDGQGDACELDDDADGVPDDSDNCPRVENPNQADFDDDGIGDVCDDDSGLQDGGLQDGGVQDGDVDGSPVADAGIADSGLNGGPVDRGPFDRGPFDGGPGDSDFASDGGHGDAKPPNDRDALIVDRAKPLEGCTMQPAHQQHPTWWGVTLLAVIGLRRRSTARRRLRCKTNQR